MSAILPAELWKESGRWEVFGPEMFRLTDRNEREFCLGPTHEEVFTNLVRYELKSHKQLPLNLYQIQTKYRDEKRPRFGLMRCREFIMKDAYTFDKDEDGMRESYAQMWKAYERIFERCCLDFRVVQGDSGAMGGSDSHEFIAMAKQGETNIVYCENCDYAATDEKAICHIELYNKIEEDLSIEMIHTPDIKSINQLKEFFNCDPGRFSKTLLYRANDEIIAVLIPGDRDVNEIKLANYLNVAVHELELVDETTIEKVTGAPRGFSGPVRLLEDIRIIVDERVTYKKNFITGANKRDHHLINVNFDRDFDGEIVNDILMVQENDKCPKCNSSLKIERGNEIGNIFQLGTKYSKSLNAKYLDDNGKEQLIVMGSHGIGVSRTMAAIIEQYNDSRGILWPISVAPYHVVVTIVNMKNDEQVAMADKIYKILNDEGVEVLIDDRQLSVGVKFNDAELIGIPIMIIVGKKASDNIVEFRYRSSNDKKEMKFEDALNQIKKTLNNNLKKS